MSRAEKLRKKHKVELAVVELEDKVIAGKAAVPRCETCGRPERNASQDAALLKAKRELRELRCVLRHGRQAADPDHPDHEASVAFLAALRQLAGEG